MTWDIKPRQDTNEFIVHDAVWGVLTDDNNQPGGYVLRLAEHGQDPYDDDVLKLLIDPEMAEALIEQFIEEARPYFAQLP